ncbi:MAG: DUF4296 domain-containing protein [Flavobacteriales bacterium]
MKHPLIFLVLGFFLLHCSREKPSFNLIPKDKMVALLAEVHLVEAHYQKNAGLPKVKEALDSSLNRVFKKHKTNKTDYENSFNYYLKNTDEYMEINSMVIQELKERMNVN